MAEAATAPASLRASISPPPSRSRKTNPTAGPRPTTSHQHRPTHIPSTPTPTLADIEAGKATITDHLAHFSHKLSQRLISPPPPRLSIPAWTDLYTRNQHAQGRHFVVHQHDHPVAGPHYDLRLQFSETSSVSWAIMYGLPGDPNSRRLNRNATETRVHCLWNHLIESASTATGSLLIWDTGEYEVLPFHSHARTDGGETTDDELGDNEEDEPVPDVWSGLTESQRLQQSFRNRRIRLRLHGARLPRGYTISLRLPGSEDRYEQPGKPARKRRRKGGIAGTVKTKPETPPTSDREDNDDDDDDALSDVHRKEMDMKQSAMQREIEEQEDEEIHRTNAYPGAANTIGSIHQRRWYLSMDRGSSGFMPRSRDGRRYWRRTKGDDGSLIGFEPFVVAGPEAERSVLTGRLAEEVMRDEDVEGFVGRKGWRAVTE